MSRCGRLLAMYILRVDPEVTFVWTSRVTLTFNKPVNIEASSRDNDFDLYSKRHGSNLGGGAGLSRQFLSSSSSCSGRIRFDSCSLYLQNKIGPSISSSVVLCVFVLLVYIVVLV